jgi:hypothetical protein
MAEQEEHKEHTIKGDLSNLQLKIVREELESLNIHVQGVMQLRSDRRYQDPAKDRPPVPPTPLSQWRVGPRCQTYVHSPNSADCECRWSRTFPQKAHCNARAASALDTRSVTTDTRTGASRVAAPTSPVGALPRENSPSAVAVGETTLRTTGAVSSGKKRGRLLQSKHTRMPERAPPQTTLSPR